MNWSRFRIYYCQNAVLGLSLDVSRVPFPDDFFGAMEPYMQQAFANMTALEKGSIANPDERRMVGHYWLRAPHLAPSPDITQEITAATESIKEFAAKVHSGDIAGPRGPFTELLVIGIGGSALGPQFVSHALGSKATDKMTVHFIDNTDPDGIDLVLAGLGDKLAQTLVIVISKSGGTVETRNGQFEVMAAFKAAGLSYARHFVAVTGGGSKLDRIAARDSIGWPAFPCGTGSVAGQASFRRSVSCRPPSRAWISGECSKAQPAWMS